MLPVKSENGVMHRKAGQRAVLAEEMVRERDEKETEGVMGQGMEPRSLSVISFSISHNADTLNDS